MRNILFFLIICSLVTTTFAEGNGGYAGAFLRLGLGARGISMGNAQVATANHGYGFYYNPAALPYLQDFSANFSYNFLSLDRKFYFVGISSPIQPQAGFSLGWIYSGVGDIKSYNSRGVETGEIDHGFHAVYFSFGAVIIEDRLSVGVNAKYLRENISNPNFDYHGQGLGADLGALLQVTSWFTVGYQLKDVNAKLKSNTNDIFERGRDLDNAFPLTSKVGAYLITPWKWARVAYDFEWSDAGEEKQHVGVEFVVPQAALRLGYDNDHLTFGGGLDFNAGFGVNTALNYAFVNSVIDEGVSHIFTWEFAF